jgi:hypothetical protein
MRINSNIPKTFAIFARKGDREGYVRFTSKENGTKIVQGILLIKDVRKASRFVNFENVKLRAGEYIKEYGFDEVKIYDLKLSKSYNVRKEKAKS